MSRVGGPNGRTGGRLSRRRWLGAALGAGLAARGAPAIGGEPPRPTAADAEAASRARAKAAGLPDFGTSRTDHYLAVGDAPAAFREEALALCERLAVTFQKHFQ